MANIEIYTLTLKNLSNNYSFNTINKYPKDVNISDIQDIDEKGYPINTTNVKIHAHLEETKEILKNTTYNKYLTALHKNFQKRIEAIKESQDNEEDKNPLKNINELKKWIKAQYSNVYTTYLDGSISEAYESGEEAGNLQMLYKIGTKLGLKMNPPPSEDWDEETEWRGKVSK